MITPKQHFEKSVEPYESVENRAQTFMDKLVKKIIADGRSGLNVLASGHCLQFLGMLTYLLKTEKSDMSLEFQLAIRDCLHFLRCLGKPTYLEKDKKRALSSEFKAHFLGDTTTSKLKFVVDKSTGEFKTFSVKMLK